MLPTLLVSPPTSVSFQERSYRKSFQWAKRRYFQTLTAWGDIHRKETMALWELVRCGRIGEFADWVCTSVDVDLCSNSDIFKFAVKGPSTVLKQFFQLRRKLRTINHL